MGKLSEKLAELSARAKHAEDAAKAALESSGEKVHEMRDKAHDAASSALSSMHEKLKDVHEKEAGAFASLKAKISGDIDHLKTRFEEKKEKVEGEIAEKYADHLENRAANSVEYALSAIAQAELDVLDAIAARVALSGKA